jgi:hypothetical protein
VRIISKTNHTIARLPADPSVFGVNFGGSIDYGLRFSPKKVMNFEFDVFVPSIVADTYILSTIPHDSFVVATRDVCARSDFRASQQGTFTFLLLYHHKYTVTANHTGLTGNDQFWSVGPNQDASVTRLLVNEVSNGFSEWGIRLGSSDSPRGIAVQFQPENRNPPAGYPPFRKAFAATATASILRGTNMTLAPPDPNCSAIVLPEPKARRGPHYRLKYRVIHLNRVPGSGHRSSLTKKSPAEQAVPPAPPPVQQPPPFQPRVQPVPDKNQRQPEEKKLKSWLRWRPTLFFSMTAKTLIIGVCVLAFVAIVIGMVIGVLLFPTQKRGKRGKSDIEALLPDSPYSGGPERSGPPSASFNRMGILGQGKKFDTYGIPLVTGARGSCPFESPK